MFSTSTFFAVFLNLNERRRSLRLLIKVHLLLLFYYYYCYYHSFPFITSLTSIGRIKTLKAKRKPKIILIKMMKHQPEPPVRHVLPRGALCSLKVPWRESGAGVCKARLLPPASPSQHYLHLLSNSSFYDVVMEVSLKIISRYIPSSVWRE